MKTYKEFQEQLERAKVVPAQIPSSEQNRERVSDAGKSRRSLVKKLMYRTSLPVKKRHEKRMSDLLTSPHHSGMHGEDFHYQEDIQQTRRDLETIAKIESETGDYGLSPMIEKVIHNAKVGYLIIPSPDQSPEEKHRSCFVTALQNIFIDENGEFDTLIIFADQQHIRNIISSLEYS